MGRIVIHSLCYLIAWYLSIGIMQAQNQDGVSFKIEGKEVVLELKNSLDEAIRDSIMISLGFSSESGHLSFKIGTKSEQGWMIQQMNAEVITLLKSLENMGNFGDGKELMHLQNKGLAAVPDAWSLAHFGYNKNKVTNVVELANGKTRFTLEGYKKAREVYLSGNFCNWSTLEYPMVWNGESWSIDIDLPHGVWGYKFVVDGSWMVDPSNDDKYDDGYGNINSKYVRNNHLFNLQGHLDAKKVFLAGNFSGWDDDGIKMRKSSVGWNLPVYLEEGTWAYKYVINGKDWILDPVNPNQRADGTGNMNSVIAIGDTTLFHLDGFTNAKEVFLTGSFNDWNENELLMMPKSNGWELPYVIGPGNYEYKYKVDGRWITDPSNPISIGEGDIKNSVIVIEPKVHFSLAGYENANEVRLTGNFNGWANPGYTMKRNGDSWKISLFLYPGKYLYKFVVDGKYLEDPNNAQREGNEFGSHNSVLWVK